MLAETAAAVGGLRNLYEMAKAVQALKTDAEIKMATAEMLNTLVTVRQQVFEAQEAEATLLKRVRELEDEVARMKEWDRQDERYELKRYYPGTYAYALKADLAGGEPPQRLCQPCYDQRKKGVLYYVGFDRGNAVHACPSCKTEYRFGGSEMPPEAEL